MHDEQSQKLSDTGGIKARPQVAVGFCYRPCTNFEDTCADADEDTCGWVTSRSSRMLLTMGITIELDEIQQQEHALLTMTLNQDLQGSECIRSSLGHAGPQVSSRAAAEATCNMQGTLFVLLGTTAAAVMAFSFSRGIGKQLASKVVQKELGEDPTASLSASSDILSRFQGLQEAVEQGNPWQQFTAILFLRLTPVVPFRSARRCPCPVSSISPSLPLQRASLPPVYPFSPLAFYSPGVLWTDWGSSQECNPRQQYAAVIFLRPRLLASFRPFADPSLLWGKHIQRISSHLLLLPLFC